jgi:mannosyltransferase
LGEVENLGEGAMPNTSAAAERVDLARVAMTNRRVGLVALAIFLIAFSVRLVDIGGRSLWVDEGATAINARLELSQLIRGEGQDPEHPSGYYALINLTSRWSDSETGLRVPSAVASSLAAVLTYLVGRRLVGHRLGLLAAAILILSPLDLWYAQEARQPVFAALAIIAGIWGLTRRDWVGYSVSVAALLIGLHLDYITAAGWLGAGAIWMVMWLRTERARLIEWLLVTGVAAAVYAPIQGSEFAAGFESLLGYEGAGIWYGELLGSNPVTSNAFGLLLMASLAVAITFALANRLTVRGSRANLWASLLAAGFALGSALTPIPRAYSVKKVLVVGWPVLALIIAFVILERVGPRWRRAMVIGLLASSLVASAASLLVPKDDWRGATAHVNSHAQAGDVVWVGPDPWAADAYHYYDGALPVMMAAEPALSMLPQGGEVWLITYRRPQDTAPSLAVEGWFDEHWRLVEETPFYRLEVRRYTP